MEEWESEELNKDRKTWKIFSLIIVLVIIFVGAITVFMLLEEDPEIPEEHTLTIDVEGEGTTDPEPGEHTYEEGIQVTITAEAGEGKQLGQWIGNIPKEIQEESEITITMDEDKELTAKFVIAADEPEEIEAASEDDLTEQISNCVELQAMKFGQTKDFELVNDINCEGTEYLHDGKGFQPIGEINNQFYGSFDGQNYTVYNLHINRPNSSQIGLFGWTHNLAEVENLKLENIKIRGKEEVGGLVGLNEGEVSNSYSSGEVEGISEIGGLIGSNNQGKISESKSEAQVIGEESKTGGLTGENNVGKIFRSYATGNVTGGTDTGGLTGYNSGEIHKTYAKGSVEGRGRTGGLTGRNTNKTSSSYATGTVEAEEWVGGITGYNTGEISNSYSIGRVKGNIDVGGLVGRNRDGKISYSYTTSSVEETGTEWSVGGLIGRNDPTGSIQSSFSDSESTDQGEPVGVQEGSTLNVEALPTWRMEQKSTYEDSGWDFNNIWKMNTYPQLQWE